ncbi:MAG: GIY-YIG nuclease family protein [Sphingobacteriaceae bacterium]|jgi:putative endonuclease
MHYVYILYSPILNKYYVGESNDVEKRLIQHNTAFYKGSYTSITNDWILKSSICFNSSSAAKKQRLSLKK